MYKIFVDNVNILFANILFVLSFCKKFLLDYMYCKLILHLLHLNRYFINYIDKDIVHIILESKEE